MARSMHRRASNVPFEKDQPGCMWSVFQLFHLHQRVNGRKPPEWSPVEEGRTAAGSKYSKLKKNKRPNLYAGVNTLVEKHDSTLKNAHGYTSPGAQSVKNSPRLTRTTSIHHLECNDYVEVVSVDGKGPSSENESAHNLRVLENFEEDYRSMPRRVISPLDAKMEEIFKNIQDPDHFSENYVQDLESSVSTSVLARSGSYPGTRRLRSLENTENPKQDQFFSYHLRTQKERAVSILQPKDVKERLKEMTNDNKVSQFIAMDGIMDKVPYGHKISHDSGDQASSFSRHLWKSKSVRESAALAEKRHAIPQFSRSRSLTESLDRYSAFLQPDSNIKLRPVPENGPSVTKGNLSLRVYGRAHSLPEFLVNFPMKESSAMLLRSASSKKDPATDLKELSLEVEPRKETSDVVNQVPRKEDDGSSLQGSKIHPSYCDDIKTEAVLTGEPGKLSPQSVLDAEFEEGTVSPFDVVGGQSDQAIHQVVQEPVDVADPNRITAEIDEVKAQVDSRDEADFSYIVNVLIRSGFYGQGKHNSPELPLSPMVFKELEGLSPETEICTLDADIDLNHLLLFDLVDEVLSDMYDDSAAPPPRPSLFDSRLKPVPTGLQCLKEVWSEVSRHSKGSSLSLNHHISRDLGKMDIWMERKLETEDAGMELEKMIWDDLLEELVLGSSSLPTNN